MSLARVCSRAWFFGPCLALGLTLAPPAFAVDAPPAPTFQAQLVSRSTGELATFYTYHSAPLWVHADGTLDPAALELVQLVETADEDGLDPAALGASALAQTVAQAQSNPTPAVLADAEVLLSRTFAAYATALRQPSDATIQYEAAQLRPHAPGVFQTLTEAAKAPVLAEYVHDMRWMHPLYAPLRRALMNGTEIAPLARQLALTNLERIRAIPAQPNGRHLLIDAANATLWMYDGDRAVDSMRVIVGKPDKQTPAYAGYVRYAILNPYWKVPDDLVQSLVARNAASQGTAYLKRQGYEVVSGNDYDGDVVDPHTVNWAAVRRGDLHVRVRQLPGPINSMGKVKYEFPNVYGIYLHDTPEKNLLTKDIRQLSSGCIRLEDAKRLGLWLMQGNMPALTSAPEQKVDLPAPVPIYVTYLTAHADGDRVAVSADPYNRDAKALASLASRD